MFVRWVCSVCYQDKRITAADALKHPWVVGDASELEKRDLRKNMDQFRLFNARRKFKSAIGSVSVVLNVYRYGPLGSLPSTVGNSFAFCR